MTESSKAVFLSYASEDSDAALRICTALRAAGVEVWFDQSELRGGDAWDQKIRRQIRSCALFLAVISARTRSRTEGYFRLEWKLAVDRSHHMAPDRPFLIPVTIDGAGAADTTVPERFHEVQWTQLPAGGPMPEFAARIAQLLEVASAPSTEPQVVQSRQRPAREEPTISPGEQAAAGGSARLKTRRGYKLMNWALVSSILLVIAGALLTTIVRHLPGSTREAPVQPAASGSAAMLAGVKEPVVGSTAAVSLRPRIAVMPFDNLSSDPSNAFFTDGVHEEILTEIANHAAGLDVISSTTMSSYRGKAVTVQTLAHDLNCTYVLEGSVQREDKEVRLTLQLIDARNDTHVWAKDYDRRLVSAMALEREVAAAVASQLSLKFAGDAQTQGVTSDPRAYDLYLKARALEKDALASGSQVGMQQARQLLDQAVAADPQFARAYLERMSLRLQQFLNNFAQPDAVLPPAQADLAAAQRLAPSDPVVAEYAGVMAYATQDYGRALQSFEQAQAAGLADAELLNWKDELLFAMGRYPEAAAISARLADLDPRNQSAQRWRIYMLMELHEYPEALRLADSERAREPTNSRWLDERDMVLAYAGGNFQPRHAELEPLVQHPWHSAEDVESYLYVDDMELTLQRRFRELRARYDSSPVEDWRSTYYLWPMYRVGRMPVAAQRGWTDLMMGDSAETKRDSERLLSYLKRTPETKWNRWFRELLWASAELFMGEGAAANQTAAAALALTRATPDVSNQMIAYGWGTEIMAWTGRKDEAAQRLIGLSTSIPGFWPGEILVDPKYSLPLADNAQYLALNAQLKEQMAALQLR